MKKKNFKGFILAETVAVSAVVIAALIIIYVQFISIMNSYQVSFKYNTVENMYSANNISEYILTDGYALLKTAITTSSYVDITSCSADYFTEYFYCEGLMDNLGVKTALFVKEDTTDLVTTITSNNPFSEGFGKFIKFIKSDLEVDKYRVIIEFTDGTYASVKIDG